MSKSDRAEQLLAQTKAEYAVIRDTPTCIALRIAELLRDLAADARRDDLGSIVSRLKALETDKTERDAPEPATDTVWTGADMIEPETDTDPSSPASHAGDQDGDSLILAFARVRAIESFATKVSMRLSYLGNCCRDVDMDRARLFYRCAAIVRDEADLE